MATSKPAAIPGNIQVSIRVRPLLPFENDAIQFDYLTSQDPSLPQYNPNQHDTLGFMNPRLQRKVYLGYDNVFSPQSGQIDVYQQSVSKLIDSFFEGYNSTCFAYGQTGSGKSYSLGLTQEAMSFGTNTVKVDSLTQTTSPYQLANVMGLDMAKCGLFQHIAVDVFAKINLFAQQNIIAQQQQQQQSTLTTINEITDCNTGSIVNEEMGNVSAIPIDESITTNQPQNDIPITTTSVSMSLVEIYMDECFDLLEPNNNNNNNNTSTNNNTNNNHNNTKSDSKMFIRDNPDGTSELIGVTMKQIPHIGVLYDEVRHGLKHRQLASTAMNATSSRSHCILTLYLTKSTKMPNGRVSTVCSKFNIVDLAGSERISKTQCQGDQIKQGIAINSSLSSLSRVITAIIKKQQLIESGQLKQAEQLHVPFRESSITRLLRDSLQGSSLTLLLACLSPASSNFEESIQTCNFASNVRGIKVSAHVQKDKATLKFEQLENEIAQLRTENSTYREQLGLPKISYNSSYGIGSNNNNNNNNQTNNNNGSNTNNNDFNNHTNVTNYTNSVAYQNQQQQISTAYDTMGNILQLLVSKDGECRNFTQNYTTTITSLIQYIQTVNQNCCNNNKDSTLSIPNNSNGSDSILPDNNQPQSSQTSSTSTPSLTPTVFELSKYILETLQSLPLPQQINIQQQQHNDIERNQNVDSNNNMGDDTHPISQSLIHQIIHEECSDDEEMKRCEETNQLTLKTNIHNNSTEVLHPDHSKLIIYEPSLWNFNPVYSLFPSFVVKNVQTNVGPDHAVLLQDVAIGSDRSLSSSSISSGSTSSGSSYISFDPTSPSYDKQTYQHVFGLNNKHHSSDDRVNYNVNANVYTNNNAPFSAHGNQKHSNKQPHNTNTTHSSGGYHDHTKKTLNKKPSARTSITTTKPRKNLNYNPFLTADANTNSSSSCSNTMGDTTPNVKKVKRASIFGPKMTTSTGMVPRRGEFSLHSQFSLKKQQLLAQQAQLSQFQTTFHNLELSLQQLTDEMNNATSNNDNTTSTNNNNNIDGDDNNDTTNDSNQVDGNLHSNPEIQHITSNISSALQDWSRQIELVEQYQLNFLQLFETAEAIRSQRAQLSQEVTTAASSNDTNNQSQSTSASKLAEKEAHFRSLRQTFAQRKTELSVINQRMHGNAAKLDSNNNNNNNSTNGNNNNNTSNQRNSNNGTIAASQSSSTYLLKNIQQLQTKLTQLEQSKQQQFKTQQEKIKNFVLQLKSSQKDYKSILSMNRILTNQNNSLQFTILGLRNNNKILKMSLERLKTQLSQYRDYQKQSFLNAANSMNRSMMNNTIGGSNNNSHNETLGEKAASKQFKRGAQQTTLARSLGLNHVPSYMLPLRSHDNPTNNANNNNSITNTHDNTFSANTTPQLTTGQPSTPRGNNTNTNDLWGSSNNDNSKGWDNNNNNNNTSSSLPIGTNLTKRTSTRASMATKSSLMGTPSVSTRSMTATTPKVGTNTPNNFTTPSSATKRSLFSSGRTSTAPNTNTGTTINNNNNNNTNNNNTNRRATLITTTNRSMNTINSVPTPRSSLMTSQNNKITHSTVNNGNNSPTSNNIDHSVAVLKPYDGNNSGIVEIVCNNEYTMQEDDVTIPAALPNNSGHNNNDGLDNSTVTSEFITSNPLGSTTKRRRSNRLSSSSSRSSHSTASNNDDNGVQPDNELVSLFDTNNNHLNSRLDDTTRTTNDNNNMNVPKPSQQQQFPLSSTRSSLMLSSSLLSSNFNSTLNNTLNNTINTDINGTNNMIMSASTITSGDQHLDHLFDCVESLARDLGLTSLSSPVKAVNPHNQPHPTTPKLTQRSTPKVTMQTQEQPQQQQLYQQTTPKLAIQAPPPRTYSPFSPRLRAMQNNENGNHNSDNNAMINHTPKINRSHNNGTPTVNNQSQQSFSSSIDTYDDNSMSNHTPMKINKNAQNNNNSLPPNQNNNNPNNNTSRRLTTRSSSLINAQSTRTNNGKQQVSSLMSGLNSSLNSINNNVSYDNDNGTK